MAANHEDSMEKLVAECFSLEGPTKDYAARIYSLVIFDKEKSLLNLVECLSSMLTNKNVEIRARATSLLAECMHCCPTGHMKLEEISTFVHFFCERLADHHSIQPLVLHGFLGLVSFHDISNQLIIKMLQSIFAEVHVQSLIQSDRHNMFNLFSNLLKCRIDALKPYSTDFVLGFIQAMDGERDPRNLLICFENSLVVIEKLDFSLFIEDFFEVLSCYFPVDFTPPKDNYFEITKEKLVLSLRRCLTTTDQFAPYAIPLYIDKLSADMEDAKIDAIITFTKCLEIYNPKDVELFVKDIWLQIRKDYLLSEPSEASRYYLKFVTNFVACLSKSDTPDSLSILIDLLIKDCLQTLKDPDMTIAVQCGDIIVCCCNPSQYAFEKVANGLVPSLQSSLMKYTSILQRKNMLEMVLKIFSVTVDEEHTLPEVLIQFVEQLLPLFYEILSQFEDANLHVLVIGCVDQILKKKACLPKVDFNVVLQRVFNVPTLKLLSSDLIKSYELVIETSSIKLPDLFRHHFIAPVLCKQLDNIDVDDTDIYIQCAKLLVKCCINKTFIVEILKHFVDILINHSKICLSLLNIVNEILQNIPGTYDQTVVFNRLWNFLFTCDNLSQPIIMELIICLSHSYNKLPDLDQKAKFDALHSIILGDDISKMQHDKIDHLKRNFSEILALSRSIFTQADIKYLAEHELKLVLNNIWDLMSLCDEDDFVLENGSISIASMVNKLNEDFSARILEHLLDMIKANLTESKKQSVVLLSWLTKALVLNWQQSTVTSIQLLLACLNNADTGCWAANAFSVITNDVDGAFDKKTGARIKFMYKQRFGQYVLPLLLEGYHNGSQTTKAFFMTAIANTLQAMPKQTFQKHLKPLMPLLLNSLATCEEGDILLSTLTTIESVLEQNQETAVEYTDTLVSRLSRLLIHPRMAVKISCLKCLVRLSTHPTYIVEPLRIDVIRAIKPILDDKKRLVRKEAVRCTNAWYMMSG